eukprot:TRINITY_DN27837_c0_g1_i1.p1 TRINITY_DN27837_c0_g1~~TRINITY_DN27837_c0_g1_i1.p1  ORF type:complete len:961 (+),score=147.20 TRINITY_DN27837_c0_g1_i1:150-3032(+)
MAEGTAFLSVASPGRPGSGTPSRSDRGSYRSSPSGVSDDSHGFDGDGDVVDELLSNRVVEHGWRRGIARVHHSMVMYKRQLYLYGGDRDEGSEKKSRGTEGLPVVPDMFFRFSVEKMRWATLSDTDWKRSRARREGHSAVVYKTAMYVFGGHRKMSFVLDFAAFDFEAGVWFKVEEKNPEAVSPRFGHAAVVAQGRMWVVGGFLRDDSPSVLVSYSFAYQTWEHHPHPPTLPLNVHTTPTAVYYNRELYVLGLFARTQNVTDIAAFDIGLGRWREIACGGIRADPAWFRGSVPTYGASAYMPQYNRLILFTSKPLVKRHSKTAKTRKERDMIVPVVYSLDLERCRWSEVKVIGTPLPACVESGNFVTKYATAVVGDTVYLVGGLGEEYTHMALTLTFREEHKSPEKESIFEFMTHWQSGFDPTERPHHTCVPYRKEVTVPLHILTEMTAPVVKLRPPEVRVWESCVYAGERRWLVDEYERSRQRPIALRTGARRNSSGGDAPLPSAGANPTLSPTSEPPLPDRDVSPAVSPMLVPSDAADDDVLMGTGVIVPRSALNAADALSSAAGTCTPSVVSPPPRKGWAQLLKMVDPDASPVACAVSVPSTAPPLSSPTSSSAEAETEPPQTPWRHPRKRRVIEHLFHQLGDTQSALAQRSVLNKLAKIGNVPVPPPHEELRTCLHQSRAVPDPHIARYQEDASGTAGEEEAAAVKRLPVHDMSALPIPLPPPLERVRKEQPDTVLDSPEPPADAEADRTPSPHASSRRRSSVLPFRTTVDILAGKDVVRGGMTGAFAQFSRRQRASVASSGSAAPTITINSPPTRTARAARVQPSPRRQSAVSSVSSASDVPKVFQPTPEVKLTVDFKPIPVAGGTPPSMSPLFPTQRPSDDSSSRRMSSPGWSDYSTPPLSPIEPPPRDPRPAPVRMLKAAAWRERVGLQLHTAPLHPPGKKLDQTDFMSLGPG